MSKIEQKISNKKDYLSIFRNKYRKSTKLGKGKILNEVTDELSIDRKYAIRLLSAKSSGRPKKPGKRGNPGKYQDYEFKSALRAIWRICDYMCSKKLKVAIPDWLPFIEESKGKYSDEIRSKLLAVSPPTIDRILNPYKATRGKSWTKNGGFREDIPIQEKTWEINLPGYIEADTVAHCGGSMGGEFINTLTVVDIATIWTETDAVYGRGSNNTFSSLKIIESELPFIVLGYDADNGGEVLNNQVLGYFTEERVAQNREAVLVIRSRAYQSNDNAHVEQRNDSIARRYLGYERLEFHELRDLISFYYRNIVCPLHNHFVPCFKLKDKARVKSKTKRIYEKPKTPYARIMASETVPTAYKDKLKNWHLSLNPLTLRDQEKIFRKKIDLVNRKLKNGEPLNKSDLQVDSSITVRPVFDSRPLQPKPLHQTAQQYAELKNSKKAAGIK
jgi:hypothetical protein